MNMSESLIPSRILSSLTFRRLKSIFLDHIIMGIIFLGIPLYFIVEFVDSKTIATLIFGVGLWCYLNKDIIGSRSVGKRLNNLVILSKDENMTIPVEKLFLRNVTVIIWPLEAVVLIVSGQRIGDFMLNTSVRPLDEKVYNPDKQGVNFLWISCSVLVSSFLSFMWLSFWGVGN
jgi:hypothetical protein